MDQYALNKEFKIEKLNFKNDYDFNKAHRHQYFEFILFTESTGKGQNNIDFSVYPTHAQSLHIIYPNQIHLLQRDSNDNGLVIQCTKEYLLKCLKHIHPEWLHIIQCNPMTILSQQSFNTLKTLFKRIKNIVESQSMYQSEIQQHYFAYLFFNLLNIIQAKKHYTTIDNTTLQFIYLSETKFRTHRTVSYYAQQLHITSQQLRKKVKEVFGKTPLQILHDLVKLEIKRLVILEKKAHKEVAYSLHFDSSASYSRFVKKHFNCTPSELQSQ